MAILKHIAGKNSNYNAAYEYLVFDHDEKSGKQLFDEQGFPIVRDKYLIEGIHCLPETFAMECRRTNQKYHKNTKQEEIKTHHYIISFDPKDKELGLTMEKAQKLGMEYAAKNFPGHQTIVATHDDGNGNHSGNIHCHIIINSVRAVDAPELPYDSRPCDQRAGFKHNCTKPLLKYLEQEVVKMCEENGYHQVDFEKSEKRITNQEYRKVHREQRSKNLEFTSEKEKLREMIDAAISASTDEESLRKYLLEQCGIEVTESRGKWGYRMTGKQKSVRARKLGDRYEKESILKLCRENKMQEELTHPETIHLPIISNGETSILYEYQMTISLPPNFGQLIDIERNQKIKNSPAYEQWAKIHNLQIQAEQFAYLSEQGLLQGDSLEQDYQKVSEEYEKVHGELKSLEADLKDLNMQLRLLGQYYSTRKEWKIYNKSGRTEECYQEHKTAIDLHEKVLGQLEEIYDGKKFPDVKWLKSRKGELIRKTKGLTQMSKKYKKYLDAFQSLTEFYIESGEKMYNKKKEAWKNL